MLTPIGSHLDVIIQRANHRVLYWRKNVCMIEERVCPWSTLCADAVESTLFLAQSESSLQLKWAWSKLGNSKTCPIRGQDTRVSDSSCKSTETVALITAYVNKMLTCKIWSHTLSNGTTYFKRNHTFLREPPVFPHYLCGSDVIVYCNWILLSYTLLWQTISHYNENKTQKIYSSSPFWYPHQNISG